MQVLIDTGIWLRAFDQTSVDRPLIVRSLRRLWMEKREIVTTSQNIAEFWNVSTRPPAARGGYGLSPSAVNQRVRWIERIARVLPFTLNDYREWRELVVHHQITGVNVHDARLVAVIATNGISSLLTLNVADFRRYPGVVVQSPSDFVASS